jgi:hypothetical protein
MTNCSELTGNASRRDILNSAIALCGIGFLSVATGAKAALPAPSKFYRQVLRIERERIVSKAEKLAGTTVETVTSHIAERSPGDKHAYYSEGDYWWPDPANPSGPYIRRDGLSNPARFEKHRLALIRLSRIVPWLASAHRLTGKRRYLEAMQRHLDGWFVNPDTRMAPHLNHAQAIIGINTGRGIGIIDTLHLVEVARAVRYADQLGKLGNSKAIKTWFRDYLDWMLTSPNGLDEQDEVNNHGTCYMLQVAAFAELLGDRNRILWCGEQLRTKLIPKQIEVDGRQPLELARTKPYGYALFNLEAMACLAYILRGHGDDIWNFRTADGRSLNAAVRWLEPFIRDKSRWQLAKDIEYFADWPMRQMALLFSADALEDRKLFQLWASLPADSEVPEIIRNTPIRQPLLWL